MQSESVFVASGIQRAMHMCQLWPVQLDNNFPHYLIDISYQKKFVKIKCVDFPYSFCQNNSHSKNNQGRYDQKLVLIFM